MQKTLNQLEPQQRRDLLVLFSAGLLFWISIGVLLPTLPAYLDAIGIKQQQIGLIIGAFAIGLLATRPLVGKLVDTRGRKLVLLIGTAVVAIAPLGYLATTSIPLLVIIRAFHGISIAAFTTAYSALVVDLAPPKQRGEIIGLMSLTNPVGIAIGPAIGGYLQVAGLYREIFWISIGCGAVAWIATTQLRQPSSTLAQKLSEKIDPREIEPVPTTSIWKILTNPALGIPALVLMLIGFPFGAIHTFLPLYIQTIHIDFNPGLFYTIAAMASFSARSLIGSRSDRYGRGIFIAGSLCCYTAGIAFLATANSELSFICGAVLEGLGSGTLIPMTVALVSDRSLPQQRGQVFSTCITGLDLGIAIAAPVFGSIAPAVGYPGIFTIGTGMAASAIVVFSIWGNRSLQHSIGFCLGRDRDVYRQN
ncbi:MFS transporter [Chamaesiphon sp.]|uniref:MFS transporter n=1 Tax=Chamaesiphon sp. TaxID=2814140 RepID=UPI003593B3A8